MRLGWRERLSVLILGVVLAVLAVRTLSPGATPAPVATTPSDEAVPAAVGTPGAPTPAESAFPPTPSRPTAPSTEAVLTESPLWDLSADAAQFLGGRAGDWGIAVVVLQEAALYMANGDEQMAMASVSKVLVMLTLMDQAVQEGRLLDEGELQFLWPMIIESDNDSTDQLWGRIGGGTAVKEFLDRIGVAGIEPDLGTDWGSTLASPRAVALILAKLLSGDILDEVHRELALELLQEVTPWQRWGVTAGAEGPGSDEDVVALKSGWYPDDEGWRIHSAGIILPSDENRPAYVIVVMTGRQESWECGVQTIEGVAVLIHSALHGEADSEASG